MRRNTSKLILLLLGLISAWCVLILFWDTLFPHSHRNVDRAIKVSKTRRAIREYREATGKWPASASNLSDGSTLPCTFKLVEERLGKYQNEADYVLTCGNEIVNSTVQGEVDVKGFSHLKGAANRPEPTK